MSRVVVVVVVCVVSLVCQALFIVLLLGWLFVPVYLTAGVSSPGRVMMMTSVLCVGSFTNVRDFCMECAVAGDHDAPVPEEEVRRDQDKPLPLGHLAVPLHFHQDLRESSGRRRREPQRSDRMHFISSLPPSPGGYVFRSRVHPAGFRVEHLRGCHRPFVNNSLVHCYRYVWKCLSHQDVPASAAQVLPTLLFSF